MFFTRFDLLDFNLTLITQLQVLDKLFNQTDHSVVCFINKRRLLNARDEHQSNYVDYLSINERKATKFSSFTYEKEITFYSKS